MILETWSWQCYDGQSILLRPRAVNCSTLPRHQTRAYLDKALPHKLSGRAPSHPLPFSCVSAQTKVEHPSSDSSKNILAGALTLLDSGTEAVLGALACPVLQSPKGKIPTSIITDFSACAAIPSLGLPRTSDTKLASTLPQHWERIYLDPRANRSSSCITPTKPKPAHWTTIRAANRKNDALGLDTHPHPRSVTTLARPGRDRLDFPSPQNST
ncbi:hypothetical protein VFPPC_17683 [Pochonia chlamydosporia 170]|uniref:Uncharacterized protein n=1 Tax=Pochonia chlamydosporia 170 TaxID=1380566 RepID=A0A219AQW0_METCM|nr:hypothetical protein VFPPC_17683 [Pochonia chlamydosporia 170]OWT43141.1 hypothetical protein VFPPC_17683 [Pochonia chlamydosporia 170]